MAERVIGPVIANRARANRPTLAPSLAKLPPRFIRATYRACAVRIENTLVTPYHTTPNILAASHFSHTKVPSVRRSTPKHRHSPNKPHPTTHTRSLFAHHILSGNNESQRPHVHLNTFPTRRSPRSLLASTSCTHPPMPPQTTIFITSEVMDMHQPSATIAAEGATNSLAANGSETKPEALRSGIAATLPVLRRIQQRPNHTPLHNKVSRHQ